MSQEVFSQMASVYFVTDGVGAIGDAGGCTLQYVLDNGGFENFDPESIMGVNGAPICDVSGASYTSSNGEIQAANPGDFDGAEIGMIAMIYGLDNEGRYEITDTGDDGNGWISIRSGVSADKNDVDVYVGGAFDTIEDALDNITADDTGGKHDCYLFTKKNETLENYTIISGGNREYNSKLFITGFNTGLLDMLPGGAYYQSDLDAWKDGIDNDSIVKLDLNDAGSLTFGGDSIIVQNLRITNNTSGIVVFFNSNIDGIVFHNCIIDDGDQLIKGNGTNKVLCFVNCYLFDAGQNIAASGTYVDYYFQGCVCDMGETDANMFVASTNGICVVADCLLIGGLAIFVASANFIEWNNTIIGHADNLDKIHFFAGATSIQVGWGDLMLLPQSGSILYVPSGGGSLLWKGFSALWGTDDAEFTGQYQDNDYAGGNESIRDFNCLDIDPEFDSDYRPRNPQILRGGSDGRSPLGAFKQKYQFPQKARIVNHGRAGILK